MMKRYLSLFIALLVLVSSAGCAAQVNADNLMENITPRPIEAEFDPGKNGDITDFAVRLFRSTMTPGENTLISPVSILYALSMTANGAAGETRQQMEAVLGLPLDELNRYLLCYDSILEDENAVKLANSIWFTADERFSVSQRFLQTNADFYDAQIYRTVFDDTTVRNINNWIHNQTDGMIEKILDEMPADALMYLVNALAFEAQWADVYTEDQIRVGKFALRDGTELETTFMYDQQSSYLETDNAKGFLKYYEGGTYAFAALLPDEGVTTEELLKNLDGRTLQTLLTNPESETVVTAIPKFELEYSAEMGDILSEMGMKLAFDENLADFSEMGSFEGMNICIDRILHKTHISVAEQGTKAGAATSVEMIYRYSAMPEETKTVYLDRPFVYMLVDTENGIPLFMGVMENPGA